MLITHEGVRHETISVAREVFASATDKRIEGKNGVRHARTIAQFIWVDGQVFTTGGDGTALLNYLSR
jgi:hypothetical protein